MLQRLTTPSIFLILVLVVFVSMLGVDEAQAHEHNEQPAAAKLPIGGQPNVSVNPPTSFSSSSTHKAIQLNWHAANHSSGWVTQYYNCKYRKKGTTSWAGASKNITPMNGGQGTVTLSNLTADTTYEFQVRTFASTPLDSMYSAWSSTQTASTLTNKAPITEGSISDRTVVEGSGFTIDVSSYFSDPNSDPLTYSATSSDTSIATVSVSDATVSVSTVAPGSATITVTATDDNSDSATQSFTVTVEPHPVPEPNGTIPDQTLKVGSSLTDPIAPRTRLIADVRVKFSYDGADTLTYSATSSDTSIATVSLLETTPTTTTLTVSAVGAGSATITVTATNSRNDSATQTFTVTVEPNSAPVPVGTIPTQTVRVGGSDATLDVSSYFSDPDGNPLTYSATSSDTSRATVSLSDATLTLTAVAAGSATITVNATDNSNAAATQSISVTVEPNSAPVRVGTIPTQTVSLSGSAVTLDVSSYFSDPDGNPLTYSATSSDTSRATVSLSDATLTLTAVAAGSATITVNATDNSNAATTQTFSVNVISNRAPTPVGTIPNQTVSLSGNAITG